MTEKRRVWPHKADLEASILGGVFLKPSVLAELHDVGSDAFFDPRHRIVWEAIRNLESLGSPIDVVTVDHEIDRTGKLDAIGGPGFLGELALKVPTAENVRHYADEILTLQRQRRAILAIGSTLERAWTWQHEPDDMIAELAGELNRIERTAPQHARVKLIDVGQALQELDSLARAPVYDTPFPTLNAAIGHGGLLGTQCYTLAAGTGRGKTSFVAQLAFHTAMQDVPVLVVSYEMKPGYFVARKAAGIIGCHSNEIIRGRVNSGLVMRSMPTHRLFMMHKPSLADVRTAVDQLTQKFGTPPLVIVDYLQKLADQISRTQARPDLRLATSEASDILVDIADRNTCAVVSVSAIGRGNNKRAANPRKLEPYELVDVSKESGNVEYDGAGLILLSLSNDFDGDERIATITLAKARFGRELHIDGRYHGARGSWRDLGEVTSTMDQITKPDPDDAIQQAVIDALTAHGPQTSMTKLAGLTGKNRSAALGAIRELKAAGRITLMGGVYQLPKPVPADLQVALSEVP